MERGLDAESRVMFGGEIGLLGGVNLGKNKKTLTFARQVDDGQREPHGRWLHEVMPELGTPMNQTRKSYE